MKRKDRKRKLKEIELVLKKRFPKESNSRIAYLITNGYSKDIVQNIRESYKNIHPEDYKKEYPIAADVLMRILYPKNKRWGREVELKRDLIKNLCLRENELIKRFRGLVQKYNYNKDESKTLELINVILDQKNITNEVKMKLKDSIVPEDSKYYNTIILSLSLSMYEK